jgi:acid phosphatase (class A)
MNKFSITALCLCMGFCLAGEAKEPSFVSPEESRADLILMAPSPPNSEATAQELAELHRIQASRSEAQQSAAMADEKDQSLFIYQRQMGAWFNPQTLPVTAAFSARVRNDEGINATPAKEAFARVRPYNQDATLHPICITKTKNDSYPSGHATAGYLLALALVDMVPQKRDAILARADDYASNRLICGVHFRSDVEAGKLLAYSVHALMASKPQYQKELAAARAEVQRYLSPEPSAAAALPQ